MAWRYLGIATTDQLCSRMDLLNWAGGIAALASWPPQHFGQRAFWKPIGPTLVGMAIQANAGPRIMVEIGSWFLSYEIAYVDTETSLPDSRTFLRVCALKTARGRWASFGATLN